MVLPDGREVQGRTWGWRERPCPLTDPAVYATEMAARGCEKVVMIGTCRARLFRLRDCFEVVAGLLRQGKGRCAAVQSLPHPSAPGTADRTFGLGYRAAASGARFGGVEVLTET